MATRKHPDDLDAAARNAMPADEFAFPRLRKEPLNDATHVRNAIARFDQVRDVTDAERDEAFRRIKRAAGRFDIDLSESRWQELGKPDATRDELLAEARRRNIRGRSSMTKDELRRALS